MRQIRVFGITAGITSPRREASALRELARSHFAAATELDLDGQCELAEFYRSHAADLIDYADDADQRKPRLFIRRDTWTFSAESAGT